jgi:hypothetical protein
MTSNPTAEFGFPILNKYILALCATACVVCEIYICFLLPDNFFQTPKDQLIAICIVTPVLMGLATLFSWSFTIRCRKIQISGLRITQQNFIGTPISIHVQDIASMKRRPFHKRLELIDKKGDVVIKIEFQVYRFADFEGWLKNMRPDLWNSRGKQTVFERFTNYRLLTILGQTLFGILGVMCFFTGLGLYSIIFIILALLFPLLLANEIRAISIEKRQMVLHYPYRTENIEYDQILDVRYAAGPNEPGHAMLVLYFHNDKKKLLGIFKSEESDLYNEIKKKIGAVWEMPDYNLGPKR